MCPLNVKGCYAVRKTGVGFPTAIGKNKLRVILMASEVAPMLSWLKGRLSDAGGPRLESQIMRVKGKPIPSLWRDEHPAIQGASGLQSTTQGIPSGPKILLRVKQTYSTGEREEMKEKTLKGNYKHR